MTLFAYADATADQIFESACVAWQTLRLTSKGLVVPLDTNVTRALLRCRLGKAWSTGNTLDLGSQILELTRIASEATGLPSLILELAGITCRANVVIWHIGSVVTLVASET